MNSRAILADTCTRLSALLNGTTYTDGQTGLRELVAVLEASDELIRDALLPAHRLIAEDHVAVSRAIGSYNTTLREGIESTPERKHAARRLPSLRQLGYIFDAARAAADAALMLAGGKDPATEPYLTGGWREETHMQRLTSMAQFAEARP